MFEVSRYQLFPPLRWVLPFAAVFLSAVAAHTQVELKGPAASIALAATLPPYDVVSIKPHISDGSGDDFWGTGIEPYGFTASNVPLKDILEIAYDVDEDQLFGLASPVSSARFDIKAKVIPPEGKVLTKLSGKQVTAMLIPLLVERFHLSAHLETRTLPVYDLVVARNGPKFQLSETELPGGGGSGSKGVNVSLNFTGLSMPELASLLANAAHRKVIDRTNLTGRADITLKWSDDVAAQQGNSNGISIFTAVEEQLGLKLLPSKGPVDTVVIDHVEMPSSN